VLILCSSVCECGIHGKIVINFFVLSEIVVINVGRCAFFVASPIVWNSCPVHIWLYDSVSTFKKQFKVHCLTMARS